ncbi:hypothetical protein NHQ30_002295 [Ciborinia camelliae]|nr:hypothetical protein NHQ30_002295 [Ciborinia camelliae]
MPAIKKLFQTVKDAVKWKRKSKPSSPARTDSATSVPLPIQNDDVFESLPFTPESIVTSDSTCISESVASCEEALWDNARSATWDLLECVTVQLEMALRNGEVSGVAVPEVEKDMVAEAVEGDVQYDLNRVTTILAEIGLAIAATNGIGSNVDAISLFDLEIFQSPSPFAYEPNENEINILLENVSMRLEQELRKAEVNEYQHAG